MIDIYLMQERLITFFIVFNAHSQHTLSKVIEMKVRCALIRNSF